MKEFINNRDIVPVISISNKDGTNINNLHKILANIKIKGKWDNTEIIEMSFEKNPQIIGDEKKLPNDLDMKNWKRGPEIKLNFYE